MLLRSFQTVHANVSVFDRRCPSILVETNRSITFGSAVRRKPNCFQLVHQMRVLRQLHGESQEEVAWHDYIIGSHSRSDMQELKSYLFISRMKPKKTGTGRGTSLVSEVWTRASELADAYKIGRAESGAAFNLLHHITPAVQDALARLVMFLCLNLIIECSKSFLCFAIMWHHHNMV